jgi:acyl carrier protein
MADIGEKVREIIAGSFRVPAASVTDATRAEDIDGWDSLAHATLILRMQRILKIRLDPGEANSVQDVRGLIALVRKAKGGNV